MEFKVICKCGTPYRFDIELENGKVPQGVKCPGCGANGSAAANALLVSQKIPLEMEGHPNGEAMIALKITCQCGLKFKIDCQPKRMKLPMDLKCPGCQDDKTEYANQLLHAKITGEPLPDAPPVTDETQQTLYLTKDDLQT
jgi:rubredoxin